MDSTQVRRARILLVDDHPVVRHGVAELLDQEDSFEVVGQAGGADEALSAIDSLHPNVVVVDISLHGTSGIELIKHMSDRHPDIKTIVFSMHDAAVYAERAHRAGAAGFVNKHESSHHLVDAVRTVLAGGRRFPAEIEETAARRRTSNTRDAIEGLTDREIEVFEMIGRGLTTRQIAERLGLSVKTIETHREKIKAKLHIRNSTELTAHAARWRMESTGEPGANGGEREAPRPMPGGAPRTPLL